MGLQGVVELLYCYWSSGISAQSSTYPLPKMIAGLGALFGPTMS